MIERFIVKHIDKVYSTKIDTYTCEDVEHWGDHQRIKLWFSSDNNVIEKLYYDLLKHKYFEKEMSILCKFIKKDYILTSISRQFSKNISYPYIYIITLTQIASPIDIPPYKLEFVAQDFPML